MTLHVVPLRRLGVAPEDLSKALGAGFSRGEQSPRAQHKYVKREFIGFKNGKRLYRYWYADDIAKERAAKAVEGTGEDEHYSITEIHKLFAHLAKNRVKPSEVTEETLAKILDMGEDTHVTLRNSFLQRFHAPWIEKEKAAGGAAYEPPRYPLQRIYRAFQMIPDDMRALVGTRMEQIVIGTREDPDEIKLWAPGEPPAGWSGPGEDGTPQVHVLADGSSDFGDGRGAFASPRGWPRFGSPFTWTEEVVWHELGHQLHDVLMNGTEAQKKVWDDWIEIGKKYPDRISDYAYTNHKEDWAETIACMISQPKQLARQCPERYDFIRKHVLPGPSREELAKMSDDELAWWDAKPKTKAAKLLTESRRRAEGPPSYATCYQSDKDQFYSVMYQGRSVFFRLGPVDKEQEAGWERMPETVDPETGLPVYDKNVGLRFQAKEGFKEIYDENGNALTVEQALLYLRQDDEGFGDKQIPEDAKDWSGKFGSTQSLAYQLYIALGESVGSQEEERARVAKARAKGKDPALERHQWLPSEMSREEFERLTPTFKFQRIGLAAEQPHVVRTYDRASRKFVTKMVRDEVTGRETAERAITVYDMPNPDGTRTVIKVNEAEPFQVGTKLLVPQNVMKKTRAGVPYPEQVWVKYRINADNTLTPEEKRYETVWVDGSPKRKLAEPWPTLPYTSPLDAARLARDLGTSAEMLLDRNGKYAAGQITDPMLAALINPSGQRIRNEGDLAELMRQSAKALATTWITVPGGSGDNPTFAHMKLTFDGGGNPLLAGEYWNRQLGLEYGSQARVDALLNASEKFELPSVKEITPKKVPMEVGRPARYKDPKTGKMVFGLIAKLDDEIDPESGEPTGRKIATMNPIKGQGTGLVRGPRILMSDLQQATSALDVRDVRKQRRDVEPLKSHLLLYLDNIRMGTDGTLRGGTVRVKLPADESITHDEIRRLPAIKTDQDGQRYVDIRDVHLLRETFGGFVMDKYVSALLEDQMRSEKRSVERSQRADVVAPSEITAPDGGVNTNEVLKGLREYTPDGKRFKLGSHQEEFLRFTARNGGRVMAAHFMGTGKTVSTIAAIKMMKNAKKEDGTPIQGAPRKRVAIVVPLNTAQQWESAMRFYTNGAATLVGASTLANAVQTFKWPEQKNGEDDGAYRARVAEARAKWLTENKQGWNPANDPNDTVIIPFEYFRDNERDLREFGDFDGIVVDEAHKIAREESEFSRAVEAWNPSMNMMLLLTGTPITNRLDTIPRYVDLLTNNKSPLGSKDEFTKRYLVPSSVMRANGSKGGALTDLNPQRAAELGSKLSSLIHVALPEDVKGKTMPAVLLDENQPAHMTGMQEKVYRLAMAALSSADMEKLEEMGALGADEKSVFTGKDGQTLRRKINIARAFANSPGYKPPDSREFVEYEEEVAGKPDKKGQVEIKMVAKTFMLPDFKRLTGEPPHGFDGKWPSRKSVRKGHISQGEYEVLSYYAGQIIGKDYEKKLAGKTVDPRILEQIQKGTVNGHSWGKIANPEYGPEGGIARGTIDLNGDAKNITVEFDGEKLTVPTGTRFIRDPNRKAAGIYYHQDDWDFTKPFTDTGEQGTGEGEGEEGEDEETDTTTGEKKKGAKRGWKPIVGKDGAELDPSIQRSPLRRRERAMFDAVMTHGNAKCDELERYMRQRTDTLTGGREDAQFILFGNRIGSSCRTMESKLRTMGYMDVNEALGHPDSGYSSEADKLRKPKMGYFVTYFGKNATLGDRDLNSEIFRKVKDASGRDTDTSMFVHRCMTGSVGKPPRIDPSTGELPGFSEGWSPAERADIALLFAGSGEKGELEAPLRVTSRIVDGAERLVYVYESALTRAEKQQVKELEKLRTSARFKDKDEAAVEGTKEFYEKKLADIFEKHITTKPPLTQRQIDVFNNCKAMVASDAAQVGLNWGNASELVMYDSLHSPMQEWQRITRAARMLDAIIPDKAKPVFDKLDKRIREVENERAVAWMLHHGISQEEIAKRRTAGTLAADIATVQREHLDYKNKEGAYPIVIEAWESLSQGEKNDAMRMGFDPVVAAESYFANRAFSRIRELQVSVGKKLRQTGRALPPTEVVQDDGSVKVVARVIKPVEITQADITNEIVEKHLTPFEREILKSRKYLVNVKRLTTSVNMPVFATVTVTDPLTGKKKKVKVPTDEIAPEAPSKAELTQLTQGRSKQVPYEFMMKTVQDGLAPRTNYDYLPVKDESLGAFTRSALATTPKKPKTVRAASDEPATPPPLPPPASASPTPLPEWKRKRFEAMERADERRKKYWEKVAVQKVKADAARKKKMAKLRKERAAAKKKGTPMKKSFVIGTRAFLFGGES